MVTRANRPQVAPVLARLWSTSTPWRCAQRGSMSCSPRTQFTRFAARRGITTCSISDQGPPLAAASRLIKAVNRTSGATWCSAGISSRA